MISIVTPCYNEEGNVGACAAEVSRVMREELSEYTYEHLFCDNASTDRTLENLRVLAQQDDHIKVIVNSRNVGPFRNMANGLLSVSGDLVVPMIPADLQDPPKVIPELVAKMAPGIEVVYGSRGNRKEGILMRLARNAYYSALRSSGGRTPGEPKVALRHEQLDVRQCGAKALGTVIARPVLDHDDFVSIG